MNDETLKTFIMVCETGSFTKTAESLFVAQPTVTKHIDSLESELGTRLIKYQRTNGGKVLLSRHGKIVLQYAKKRLREKEELFSELEQSQNSFPEEAPPKRRIPLCEDPAYIDRKKLNHMVQPIARTRKQRKAIYDALREDNGVRKKDFIRGAGHFFYYHREDVERYIAKKLNGSSGAVN